MQRDLPSGTVTFLFTDIEGSTKLLHELGADGYAAALAEHRRILRETFGVNGGVEVDTQGDAFFVAFPTASGALQAAVLATEGLASGPIQVRMAIHTGTPFLGLEGYVGVDVHRGARIGAAGHGGQLLVSAATAALIGTDGLRDLGLHRLKDLSAPEHIYQVGTVDFPALKTLYQTNLPVPTTTFLGREHELATITGLLTQPGLRLLTLTGPGGTGKTRLALQAAAELSDGYPQGVWWIPVADLREPSLVLETAARALGANGGLAEHIGNRAMLIVFDNFEQVIEAAADLASLLSACPKLDLLVTSRESLRIGGEQEYPVPPLLHAEGVELFVSRARAVRPDFAADTAVSEICRRLDDLPLALELAAARVKALSSKQILERLEQRLPLLTGGARDLPERQRTLRATIAWSHDLLTSDEQRLFARLAVFRGGCTLEAAESIVEADLDQLQSLVDKSLVRHAEERFWMLETIREYATERLEASGEAADLQRRHAEYFLALAEEAEPHVDDESLRGGRTWLDRLEREHDNLRAALDQLEASDEIELELRMAAALSDFWLSRGHVAEGGRRLEFALRADQRPTTARAKALMGASHMAALSGDHATMRLLAEEAFALQRSHGDWRGAARSLSSIGYAIGEEGDWERAQQTLDESLRLSRDAGDEHHALWTTRSLAWAYANSGDLKRARATYEDGLHLARELGSRSVEAALLGSLAWLVVREGGPAQDSLPLLKQSMDIKRAIGDRIEIAIGLCGVARVMTALGSAGTAVRLVSCFQALSEEIGGGEAWVARMNEATLATTRTQLDEAAFVEAWEHGRTLSVDQAVALALDAIDRAT